MAEVNLSDCAQCGKAFTKTVPGKKFCSDACSRAFRNPPPPEVEYKCRRCGRVFLSRSRRRAFCSRSCRLPPPKVYKLVCRKCGRVFESVKVLAQYCSQTCWPSYRPPVKTVQRMSPIPPPASKPPLVQVGATYRPPKPVPIFTPPRLWFNDEKQFSEWFSVNYFLFGIKSILKHDDYFPDVRAELCDGSVVDIELEYRSDHFVGHGHEASRCHLIISFLKPFGQSRVKGIPVVAVYNCQCRNDHGQIWDRLELTDYFRRITNFCDQNLRQILPKIIET